MVLVGLALGRTVAVVLGRSVPVGDRAVRFLEQVADGVALLALAVPLVDSSGHDVSQHLALLTLRMRGH